jgi:type III pantothenate kinase
MIAEDGSFMGGCIATGIRTSARALWGGAAMLPEIEIKKPEVIMGQETITSMQAGLVYGYIGQTEYIVQKMKKETGLENVKVIATGGLGKIIVSETDVFDAYDQNLTLDGLRILYEKNKK